MLRGLTSSTAVPAWWPARLYYGWALVGALGVTATASYGVLSYAFAVFIEPMERELGWSKTAITGAFSVASLVAGLAAVPVGRWVDRHGARGIMTVGSLAATLLLVGWSQVQSLAAFYALWALLGVASAAVLYEPAFAIVAAWFRARRGSAFTMLTFIGGFASVLFVPLATWLVATHGWRDALVWLAVIYAVITVPLHGLLLRRRPEDVGLEADGGSTPRRPGGSAAGGIGDERSVAVGDAIRGARFRWLAVAFGVSTLATTAVSVHLVPLLLERGFGLAFAGGAMGALGLVALPGRLVFTPLGDRWPRTAVTASIFALQAAGCVALLATDGAAAVWVFVVLFGAGFGAITPARAALVAELYGPAQYGGISGVLALALSVTRAAAPVGASVVHAMAGGTPAGGYDTVVLVLLGLCLLSGVAIMVVREQDQPQSRRSQTARPRHRHAPRGQPLGGDDGRDGRHHAKVHRTEHEQNGGRPGAGADAADAEPEPASPLGR